MVEVWRESLVLRSCSACIPLVIRLYLLWGDKRRDKNRLDV